jgi:hypothetical protein
VTDSEDKALADFERQVDHGLQRLKDSIDSLAPPKNMQQVIFDEACGFHLAAHRCAKPEPDSSGKPMCPMTPTVVCLAFSIELYLKALLTASGTNAKGHDLNALLGRLAHAESVEIAEQYARISGRSRPQFKRDMGEVAKAFVDWRYVFEKGETAIPLGRLGNLARATYRHCRAAHPEWAVADSMEGTLNEPLPEEIERLVSLGRGRYARVVVTGR